jgi:CRP-like cAMP-binding protein
MDIIAARPRNRLLAAIPAEDFALLAAQSVLVPLALRHTLFDQGEAAPHVWFPLDGVVSRIHHLADGSAAEVGITGREGMVAPLEVLADSPAASEAVVQASGEALRLPAATFRSIVRYRPGLMDAVVRYAGVLSDVTAVVAACNMRHTLPERLARWLLMLADLAGTNVLPLRHEFIASMLGVRRAGVTEAVGALRSQGVIETPRDVVITDRAGLERLSCGCYRAVRNAYRVM